MTQPDLNAQALASVPLTQVTGLVRWVGAGRKLTAKGNLTRADGRELIELLKTGDEFELVFADTVMRKSSTDRLPGLVIVVQWAKAVGLVRRQGGRLIPVKKNANLLDRPRDLWAAMLGTVDQIADELTYSPMAGSALNDDWKQSLFGLFGVISDAGGAMTATALADMTWRLITLPLGLDRAPIEDQQRWRSDFDSEIQSLLKGLIELGALTEDDSHTLRVSPLAAWTFRRGYGVEGPRQRIAHIKITLTNLEPAVWRRVLVPADIRLDRLHHVIQGAMGWLGMHLHTFTQGEKTYSAPDPDMDWLPETAFTLSDLAGRVGDRFEYEYDLGDSWEHIVEVEDLTTADPDVEYPVVTDGARACPPEDSGGVSGYKRLIKILADPKDSEHEDMVAWVGRTNGTDFDPDRFDVADANQAVDRVILSGESTFLGP